MDNTADSSGRTLSFYVFKTAALAVLIPPFAGGGVLMFAGFWTFSELLIVFTSFSGLYVVLVGGAVFTQLPKVNSKIEALVAMKSQNAPNEAVAIARLRYLPLWLILSMTVYSCIGVFSADLSLAVKGIRHYSLADYLHHQVGSVPVALLSSFPLFFYSVDWLGRFLGPRGIVLNAVPLHTKLIMLGVVTPVLIDTLLIAYYYNETGFFSFKTAAMWISLVLLAVGSTWLVWRSMLQGIGPIQAHLDAIPTLSLDNGQRITPTTLDEFGLIATRFNELKEMSRQARNSVLEIEGRLGALVSAAPVTLYQCLVAHPHTLTYVSENVVNVLGFPASRFTDDPDFWVGRIHPDDVETYRDAIARLLEVGESLGEYRYLSADGVYRCVRDGRHFAGTGDGASTQVVGYWLDVTDQKRSEQLARETFKQLQLVIESAPVVFWMIDANHVFTLSDGAALRDMGLERNEIVGLLMEDFYQDTPENIENITRALAGENMRWETVVMGRLFDALVVPIYDEKNEISSVVGVGIDITEQRQALAELTRANAALEQAQEVGRLGSWYADIGTGTLRWSAQTKRIFGSQHENISSFREFNFVIFPDDRSAVMAAWNAALAGAPFYVEHRVLVDDEVRWVAETAKIEYDADGRAIAAVGTTQDISERRAVEEKLLQLNDELERRVEERTLALETAQKELVKSERLSTIGQLTATVSHEIRNPLGTITASLHVLKKVLGDCGGQVARSLERIERNAGRCDTIIDELLDFTRYRELILKRTDIGEYVQRFLDDYQAPFEQSCVFTKPAEAFITNIDEASLHRALINILDNACHAVHEKAELGEAGYVPNVRILLRKGPQRRREIVIEDNGPGMSAETRERIFDPLFSTKAFGVGLGMVVVKNIMEQHEGGIDVASEPGAGCAITLWLPAAGTALSANVPDATGRVVSGAIEN